MTTDNFVKITFFNINIKLWLFDPFSPKLFYNKMHEKYITQKINDVIDYIICKNNPCGLKPPCTWSIQINQVQTPMRKRKLNLWQSTYLDMMRLFCKKSIWFTNVSPTPTDTNAIFIW